jgi:hypothetical protein
MLLVPATIIMTMPVKPITANTSLLFMSSSIREKAIQMSIIVRIAMTIR